MREGAGSPGAGEPGGGRAEDGRAEHGRAEDGRAEHGPARGEGSDRGLRFSQSSALVSQALELLERGPQPAHVLARDVLGIEAGPSALSARMVRELLADERRATEEGDVWRLDRSTIPEPSGALAALDYVVVDVETTGSSPRRGDRVTEIAAVEVSGGEVAGEFSSLVNPGRPIPAWITRLTGISQEMVQDAPRFADVADLVRERLEGRIFVAHNVPFDWRFVAEEMRRARSMLPVGPRLCTLRLSRRALPGLSRKGLDAVSRYFDVEIENRHRALGDALATATVLLRLLEGVDRRGIREWDELKRWLAGESRRPDGRAG